MEKRYLGIRKMKRTLRELLIRYGYLDDKLCSKPCFSENEYKKYRYNEWLMTTADCTKDTNFQGYTYYYIELYKSSPGWFMLNIWIKYVDNGDYKKDKEISVFFGQFRADLSEVYIRGAEN